MLIVVSLNSTLPSITSISVIRSAFSGVVITDVTLPTRMRALLFPYPAFSSTMQSLPSSIFKFSSDKFHTWTFAVLGLSTSHFSTLNETCSVVSVALWIFPIIKPFDFIFPHFMVYVLIKFSFAISFLQFYIWNVDKLCRLIVERLPPNCISIRKASEDAIRNI